MKTKKKLAEKEEKEWREPFNEEPALKLREEIVCHND